LAGFVILSTAWVRFDERRGAGDKPAEAKVRRLVIWIAGWRATKTLKPIDKVFLGKIHESLGRNENERISSLENARPEGRALHWRAKAAWGAEIWLRHFTSAGWKRQHGDEDTLSNWRSPPRPGAKSPEQGRSYNRVRRAKARSLCRG